MVLLTQNLFFIFWIGVLIVGIATVLGWTRVHRPPKMKYICYLHTFGFFLMICGFTEISRYLGFSNILSDFMVKVLLFVFGFGAFLESRRRFPLMKPRYVERINQLLLDNPEKIELALKEVDEIGLFQAFEKHNIDFDYR